MFTLDQIVSFCAVYEQGSYSAAARKLGKDRLIIKEDVNLLKDTVGLPLFDIHGRQAVPTEIAENFYPRSVTIARQIMAFEKLALNAFQKELSIVNVYHDAMIPQKLMANLETQGKSILAHT